MRRTVADNLHRKYQQPLHSSFLNESVFEQGSHVSPELGGDSSVVRASSGCIFTEHDSVERVPPTKIFVASLSPSAVATMSHNECPIVPVSSVLLVFSSPSGPSTVGITSSQPEVSSLQVSSEPKALTVPASSIPFATSSVVLPPDASPPDSAQPLFSGAAQMVPANADTALLSRGLL